MPTVKASVPRHFAGRAKKVTVLRGPIISGRPRRKRIYGAGGVGVSGVSEMGGGVEGGGVRGDGDEWRTLPIASIALSKNMTTPPVKKTPPASLCQNGAGAWCGGAKLPRSYLPPVQKAAPTSGDSHAVSWAWGSGRRKREGGGGRGKGGGDILCVSESQKEDMAVEGGGSPGGGGNGREEREGDEGVQWMRGGVNRMGRVCGRSVGCQRSRNMIAGAGACAGMLVKSSSQVLAWEAAARDSGVFKPSRLPLRARAERA